MGKGVGAPTKTLSNRLRRLLGLEVEITRLGNFAEYMDGLVHQVQVVRDSSLPETGREIITPALGGDTFVTSTTALAWALAQAKCTVNETCGLHVHVDARDIMAWELRRVLMMYETLEEIIYDHLAPSREYQNPINHKWYNKKLAKWKPWVGGREGLLTASTTDGIKEQIIRIFYGVAAGPAMERLRTQKYVPCRYLGLNVHSYFYRSTLEWRMHPGTCALRELLMWPMFCGHLVQLSTAIGDKDATGMSAAQILQALPKHVREWCEGQGVKV